MTSFNQNGADRVILFLILSISEDLKMTVRYCMTLMESRDFLSYALAGLSLVSLIAGVFAPQYKIPALIGGFIGLGISLVLITVLNYFGKIEKNSEDIKTLRNEIDDNKKYSELREELAEIRGFLKINKINTKKKAQIDITQLITIIMIITVIYFILLAFGIIKPN